MTDRENELTTTIKQSCLAVASAFRYNREHRLLWYKLKTYILRKICKVAQAKWQARLFIFFNTNAFVSQW